MCFDCVDYVCCLPLCYFIYDAFAVLVSMYGALVTCLIHVLFCFYCLMPPFAMKQLVPGARDCVFPFPA